MPLVRIDLIKGKSLEYRSTIGAMVYDSIRAALKVPENVRFQLITGFEPETFIYDPACVDIERSGEIIFTQVNSGKAARWR